MDRSVTTSTGSTITLTGNGYVILDHPASPDDMRHQEAGRVVDGGFQPASFAAWYDDDRPGSMRIHVSEERSRLACARYLHAALRDHAREHGLVFSQTIRKGDMAWSMAQHGLIDAEGHLRDGFPGVD